MPPREIVKSQQVRPLPGQIDRVPVFNSNSPELILEPGILLSTFPSSGKTNPEAHLNYPLEGRFDIFAHHVAKAATPEDLRSLYLGIILHNPTEKTVTVNILAGASYLSQPDAPFIKLGPLENNPLGKVYAGPGSRVTDDILRGKRQDIFSDRIAIGPRETRAILNLPIPVKDLQPPINGRSTYLRLQSDGRVYAASLAKFAPLDREGEERKPTVEEWLELLNTGNLAQPRDRAPTPLGNSGNIIYGRVAGISIGSQWRANLVDKDSSENLTIPDPGAAFSYGLSTLYGGRLGTNQIQTAKMAARYEDTAYQAHGNYGVQYSLSLPLYNPKAETKTVNLSIDTPIKQDRLNDDNLLFLFPRAAQVFFRGTVRVKYNDDLNLPRTRYVHLVQHRGEMGKPILTLNIPGRSRKLVYVDFLYPPDSTPPQILTIKTSKK
ncbi:MAG: DUF3370 domain-containing protein [Prochloraceae cyanobacterium]